MHLGTGPFGIQITRLRMKSKLVFLLAVCCLAYAFRRDPTFPTGSRTSMRRRLIRSVDVKTTDGSYGNRPFRPEPTPKDPVTMIKTSKIILEAEKLTTSGPSFPFESTTHDILTTQPDKETTSADPTKDTETTKLSSEPLGTTEAPATTPKNDMISTSSKVPVNSAGFGLFTEARSIFVDEARCKLKHVEPTAATQETTQEEVDGLVQPEINPQKLSYIDHSFYKSALVCNKKYFEEHWNNITSGADRIIIHPTVKNGPIDHAYRDFSLQMRLPFEFPFYGHYLRNVTVCTSGYVFTGTSGHRWFAQEQNISPLMANFDISLDETSSVVLYEKATHLTIVWENMRIRERRDLKFTFAVTLYKNGDIYFAYKDIPIKIQAIDDKNFNVFVGLADSYFLNKVTRNVRRKTIHNYSRIPFNIYRIKSNSVLQLIALPSCPIYNTCRACMGHEAKYGSFKCNWCEPLRKCTSGADFYRPYMADCPFNKFCNATAEDNETLPHLSFFHRVLNYAM